MFGILFVENEASNILLQKAADANIRDCIKWRALYFKINYLLSRNLSPNTPNIDRWRFTISTTFDNKPVETQWTGGNYSSVS